MFYTRRQDGFSRDWIQKMKFSMQTLGPIFNTNRMIEEYTKKFYIPTAIKHNKLKNNNFEFANKKADWTKNIYNNGNSVKIVSIQTKIYLGSILPDDISVQIYSGYLNEKQSVSSPCIDTMNLVSRDGDNYVFEGKMLVDKVGKCGYAVRVSPQYDGEVQYMPEIIK